MFKVKAAPLLGWDTCLCLFIQGHIHRIRSDWLINTGSSPTEHRNSLLMWLSVVTATLSVEQAALFIKIINWNKLHPWTYLVVAGWRVEDSEQVSQVLETITRALRITEWPLGLSTITYSFSWKVFCLDFALTWVGVGIVPKTWPENLCITSLRSFQSLPYPGCLGEVVQSFLKKGA